MYADKTSLSIISIDNNGCETSFFTNRDFILNGSPERFLSEQISAENFRLRSSHAEYSSGFHVAGDPTLIVVLSGILRIELRSGKYHDFAKGEMFIANDFLAEGVEFDDTLHGHRAEVVGEQELKALHLKLEKREI